MPSTSAKQAKFMRAVAHSPEFAKKVSVPQSVGKDFSEADKRMNKYNKGGKPPMVESKRKPLNMRRAVLGTDKEIVERGNRTPYEPIPKDGPKKETKPLGRAGAAGYKSGGSVMKKAADGCAKKGKTKGMMVKMAKGGSVSSRADGCAKKGRTSTKHVAMRNGGSC